MAELDEMGLIPLAQDLADRRVEADQIEDELTYCWWSSLLARILRDDPAMGGLDASALNDMADSLRELDAAQAACLAGPVAHACARRVRAAIETDKNDARELYRALSRENGVPLRDIIASHPVALVAKPVWIVPPTLVPQVFIPDAVIDLAILDASTPMPVAQVMPAFVRAEQVLVVGDPRRATTGLAAELRLPPSWPPTAMRGSWRRCPLRRERLLCLLSASTGGACPPPGRWPSSRCPPRWSALSTSSSITR